MNHSFETAARVNLKMPEYFKIHGYKCPTDIKSGPFQFAFDTELTYFDFLHQDPRRMKNFNTYMSGNRSVRKHWVEWFPVRELLLDGFLERRTTANDILLVDMGGGLG